MNFLIFKTDLEKAEEPEIKLPTSAGSLIKQESSRKYLTTALLTTPKPLTLWFTHTKKQQTNPWKVLQKMGIPGHLTCLLRNLYACQEATVRTGHEQKPGSKLGKKSFRDVYCHPAFFNFYAEYIMRNAGLDEAQAGIKTPGEISITLDMQITPPLW